MFSTGSNFNDQNNDELFYRLTAYGRDFHFNLTRNDRLTSPSLVVEYWSRDGTVRRLAEVTSRRCHYVGHIASEETTSSVAFSNCFGLVGCLPFSAAASIGREKSRTSMHLSIATKRFLHAFLVVLEGGWGQHRCHTVPDPTCSLDYTLTFVHVKALFC